MELIRTSRVFLDSVWNFTTGSLYLGYCIVRTAILIYILSVIIISTIAVTSPELTLPFEVGTIQDVRSQIINFPSRQILSVVINSIISIADAIRVILERVIQVATR